MIKQISVVSIGVGFGRGETTKKLHREAVAHTLKELVRRWHDKYLPQHFEMGAPQRYGYQARKEKWLKTKRRLADRGRFPDARLPLVFRGKLREMMTRSIRITYSGTKATGYMTGPFYLHMRGKFGGAPEKGKEIIAHNQQELQEQKTFAHEELARRINLDTTFTTEIIA